MQDIEEDTSPNTSINEDDDNILPCMIIFPENISVVNVNPQTDFINPPDPSVFYRTLSQLRLSSLCSPSVNNSDITSIITHYEEYLSFLLNEATVNSKINSGGYFFTLGPYGSNNVGFEKCLLLYNIGISNMKLASYKITTSSSKDVLATNSLNSKITSNQFTDIRDSLCKTAGIFEQMNDHIPLSGHWGVNNPSILRRSVATMWKDLSITLSHAIIYEQAKRVDKQTYENQKINYHEFLAKIAQGIRDEWNKIAFEQNGNSLDESIDQIYINLMGSIYKALPLYHWALYHETNQSIDERRGKIVKCLSNAKTYLQQSLAKSGFKNIGLTEKEKKELLLSNGISQMFTDFIERVENGNELPTSSDRRRQMLKRNEQIINTAIHFYHKINELYDTHKLDNDRAYHDKVPKHLSDFKQPIALTNEKFHCKIIPYELLASNVSSPSPVVATPILTQNHYHYDGDRVNNGSFHPPSHLPSSILPVISPFTTKNTENMKIMDQLRVLKKRMNGVKQKLMTYLSKNPHRNINFAMVQMQSPSNSLISSSLSGLSNNANNRGQQIDFLSTQALQYANYQDQLLLSLINMFESHISSSSPSPSLQYNNRYQQPQQQQQFNGNNITDDPNQLWLNHIKKIVTNCEHFYNTVYNTLVTA